MGRPFQLSGSNLQNFAASVAEASSFCDPELRWISISLVAPVERMTKRSRTVPSISVRAQSNGNDGRSQRTIRGF
jgi:hypothetical protein